MPAGGKVCNPLPQIEGGELGRADLRYIKHPKTELRKLVRGFVTA